MKNVLLKNSLFCSVLAILFLFCRKEEKLNTTGKKVKNTNQVQKNITLPLDVNFSDVRESRVHFPSADWEKIAPDGYIFFSLTLGKRNYLIKTKFKSSNQAINFTLSDEVDKKVTLLIEQAYYPFDDSLIFVKKNNTLHLKSAYTTEYDEVKYRNYIREKKIIHKGVFFKLE